jgi:hypothetical protein
MLLRDVYNYTATCEVEGTVKADELYRQLSLFTKLTQKQALTASYRALAFGVDYVRACGLFGQMESFLELGLGAEAFVDCEDFLQLLRSLPAAEFKAELVEGALHWSCGAATGHLTLMAGDREQIVVPSPVFNGMAPEGMIAAQFGEGLELGALSCGSSTVRLLGLQGVQISNSNGRSYARATDNTTLSSCCLGPELDGSDTITLLPEAIELLAALIKRDGDAMMAHDDSSVFCVTENTRLLLYQVPPLRTNVGEILSRFTTAEVRQRLNHEAVAAFLKRAMALSEGGGHAMVEISVDEGRTRLSFNEIGSSSQEYYPADDGPRVTVPAIRLEASRLAKALAHADELVFDYAAQNVLLLRGDNEFTYAITGRRE